MFVRLLKPLVLSPFARQSFRRYLSKPNHADLTGLKELAEAGKLRVVIDRIFTLEQTRDALTYIEGGHVHGKVVITI
jgi:NADPH:quinone reductase-like Zn-dependent oxidoreductase